MSNPKFDHQQAAIDAAAEAWWRRDYPEYGPWQDAVAEHPEWASEIRADCAAELTAATPHLRAETVDRLKNFRNDYQHTYAIPGDPYADGYLTACNAIIALLEGGGE